MKILEVYTDGAASPNPGKGAWAYCIVDVKKPIVIQSGYQRHATCNQMEMQAVIEALKAIKNKGLSDCYIYLHTDSQYVQRGITEWIDKWIENGWKSSTGAVKNIKLWKEIINLSNDMKIHYQWVRGHSGNKWNEFVDKLCSEEITKQIKKEANNG